MNYIEALKKRYSVKKFDKERQVPREKLLNILEAGKLSASSLGLQPYRILVIESEDLRQSLIPAFQNPSQISTCSHLIVIVSKKNLDVGYIDAYLEHITETRELEPGKIEPFRGSINHYMDLHNAETLQSWNEKQAYIVLGNLIMAAALEEVDTCPMEGFRPDKLSELLGIDASKESIPVTLALGYRAEDDNYQFLKKVRKPEEKLYKFL